MTLAEMDAHAVVGFKPDSAVLFCIGLLLNRIMPSNLKSRDDAVHWLHRHIARVQNTTDPELPDSPYKLAMLAIAGRRASQNETVLGLGRMDNGAVAESPITLIGDMDIGSPGSGNQPYLNIGVGPVSVDIPLGDSKVSPIEQTHWYQPGEDLNPGESWLQDLINGGGFNWGRD